MQMDDIILYGYQEEQQIQTPLNMRLLDEYKMRAGEYVPLGIYGPFDELDLDSYTVLKCNGTSCQHD